jgi:hypothetical protein
MLIHKELKMTVICITAEPASSREQLQHRKSNDAIYQTSHLLTLIYEARAGTAATCSDHTRAVNSIS